MTRESPTETVLRSRLLPRVSFQTMMLLMTASAVLFAVAFAANQGADYAKAATVGMIFLSLVVAVGVLLFLASWAASQFSRRLGMSTVTMGFSLLFVRLFLGEDYASTLARPLAEWLGPLAEWSALQMIEWPWLINFQVIGWALILFPIGVAHEDEASSPFAEDQLPPQILAPRDPVQ